MSLFGFGEADKISSADPLARDGNGNQNDNSDANNQNGDTSQGNQNEDSIFGNFVDLNADDDSNGGFKIGEDFFKPPVKKDANGNVIPEKDPAAGTGDETDTNESMIADLQKMIKSVRMTDDMIPENFDSTDPKQFRSVVESAMQMSIAATMSVMTKPIQAAMDQMARQLEGKFKQGLQSNNVLTDAERHYTPIHEALAGLGDKGLQAWAKQSFERSLNVVKSPQKAAEATVQMLKQMGFNVDVKNRRAVQRKQFGDDDNQDTGGVKSGDNALDSFFGAAGSRR